MLNIFVWGLFLIIVLIILLNVMSSVGLTKNQKEIFLKDFENFLETHCGKTTQFDITEQTKKFVCLDKPEVKKEIKGVSYFYSGEEEKEYFLFKDKYYFNYDEKYFYFDKKEAV